MPSISMIVMPATIKEVTTTTARSNFRCLFRSMSSRGRWFSRRWKIPPVARISDPEAITEIAMSQERPLSWIKNTPAHWLQERMGGQQAVDVASSCLTAEARPFARRRLSGVAQSRASSPACLAHSSLLTRPGKNSIASLTSSSIFGVILLT